MADFLLDFDTASLLVFLQLIHIHFYLTAPRSVYLPNKRVLIYLMCIYMCALSNWSWDFDERGQSYLLE